MNEGAHNYTGIALFAEAAAAIDRSEVEVNGHDPLTCDLSESSDWWDGGWRGELERRYGSEDIEDIVERFKFHYRQAWGGEGS